MAYDGGRIWTANDVPGSVSIVTPTVSLPWTVTTVTVGFSAPLGAVFDGANVWITDFSAGSLLKLDAFATILQTVTVGVHPVFPVFDGTSVWVPNQSSGTVSVVRASTGTVLATLTGNGLAGAQPTAAAFDGEKVMIANQSGNSVSLFKAADLTPLGSFQTGPSTSPNGACSDGVNFWITLFGANQLARF